MTIATDTIENYVAKPQMPGGVRRSNGTASWQTENQSQPGDHTDDARRILDAAISILYQGEDLLRVLTPQTYTQKNRIVFNASIGGHYRHCLDHFTSLLRGWNQVEINYDHRDRDARIETQPEFAIGLTRQLRRTLEQLSPESLETSVMACCEVSYRHGDSPITLSSHGRELVYAIAHSIHHYALISVMARLMEIKLPETFGVAPSTLAHQLTATTR